MAGVKLPLRSAARSFSRMAGCLKDVRVKLFTGDVVVKWFNDFDDAVDGCLNRINCWHHIQHPP